MGMTLARIILCLGWTGLSFAASPTPLGNAPVGVQPSAQPSPQERSLTPQEQASLLKEFSRAQYSEMKGLEHRYDVEFEELKSAQKIRLKEWKRQEQVARHQFWEEHEKGQEKRAYIQKYLERFNLLRKSLADEKKAKAEEQKAHILALKKEQAKNAKAFRSFIDQKIQPPQSLWPRLGR